MNMGETILPFTHMHLYVNVSIDDSFFGIGLRNVNSVDRSTHFVIC